mgnify:CR=1 FL=1
MSGYKINQIVKNSDANNADFDEKFNRLHDNSEFELHGIGENFYIGQVISGMATTPVGDNQPIGNQPRLVDLGDGVRRFEVRVRIISDTFFPSNKDNGFTNFFSNPLSNIDKPGICQWQSSFHPRAFTENSKVQVPFFGSFVSLREKAGVLFVERIINTTKVLFGGMGEQQPPSGLFASLGPFPDPRVSWDTAAKVMPKNCKKMECIDPEFRPLLTEVMNKLKARGYDPMIGSGYRNLTSQIEKIKEGKSKAKNPFGYHVCLNENGEPSSMAVDLVHRPVGWGGKTTATKLKAYEFFDALGKIVLATGKITWGGSWTPKKRTIGGKEFFIGWDPAHINLKVSKQKLIKRTVAGIVKLAGAR